MSKQAKQYFPMRLQTKAENGGAQSVIRLPFLHYQGGEKSSITMAVVLKYPGSHAAAGPHRNPLSFQSMRTTMPVSDQRTLERKLELAVPFSDISPKSRSIS